MYAPRRSSGEKSSSLSRSLPRNPLPTSLSRCPRGTRVGRARDVVRARVLVSARARGSGSFPAGRLRDRPAPPPACAPGAVDSGRARPPARAAAHAARAEDIGPVTLDFSKLVQPGDRALAAYERLAASGVLRRDDAQRSAIAVLDRLHRTLETNRGGEETPPPPPSPKREGSWFADLFGGPPPRESSAARRDQNQPHAGGVYLHGGPGCGKTFCMDLAYACLPGAAGVGKRREHATRLLETHAAPRARQLRRAPGRGTPSRRTRARWRGTRGCCAWTSSRSPTSPTR